MSEQPEDKPENDPLDTPETAPAEEAAADPTPDPEPDAAPDSAPVDREAELEAEVAELKDKLLRALAETENVRRRADREKDDASKYAITNFAREMLTVADNLRRALASLPEEARSDDPILSNLLEGVEMTEKEMLSNFERFGITPVEALGKKVDPNFHEALFEVEDPNQVAGTIVQVLDTGYVLKDRLLRPARVGVAKGGPKEAPSQEAPTTDGEAADDEAAGAANSNTARTSAYEKRPDSSRKDVDRKV